MRTLMMLYGAEEQEGLELLQSTDSIIVPQKALPLFKYYERLLAQTVVPQPVNATSDSTVFKLFTTCYCAISRYCAISHAASRPCSCLPSPLPFRFLNFSVVVPLSSRQEEHSANQDPALASYSSSTGGCYSLSLFPKLINDGEALFAFRRAWEKARTR